VTSCSPGFPHGNKDKIDGVVMVNFGPDFVAKPGKADVKTVADHVEHIARIAGKKQYVQHFAFILREGFSSIYMAYSVGIGSDFDGISSTPQGLGDVSKYANLVCIHYSVVISDSPLTLPTPSLVCRAHLTEVGLGRYISCRTCGWESLESDGCCRAGCTSDAERRCTE
jgi:Membrane dipeptidase (Peptidase family M19)